jgi:hypothetical protein
MNTRHIFNSSTGLLTGATITGPDEHLPANTPVGHGTVSGVDDWQCQRVDINTGAVVDWQPAPPPDDAMRTWRWDAPSRRWVAQQTAAASALDVRAERDRRLAACDWVVTRAAESSLPVPAVWRAYRQALRELPMQPEFPAAINWPSQP